MTKSKNFQHLSTSMEMVKSHVRKCVPEKKLQGEKVDLDEKIRRIREQNKAREKRFKEIEDDKLHASNDHDTRNNEKSKAVDCQSGTAMKGVMAAGGKKVTKGRGQKLLEMSKAPLRAMEFESRARKKLKELEENGQFHKESKSLAQLSMENKSLPKKDEWDKNGISLKETQEVLPNTVTPSARNNPPMDHRYSDKKDESKQHSGHDQKQYDRPELRKAQGSSWTPMKPNDSQGNTSEVNYFCSEDWSTEVMDIDELMIKPNSEALEQSKEQVPTGENSNVKQWNSVENEQHTTNEFCSEDWSTEVIDIDELMIKPNSEALEQSKEQVPTGENSNVKQWNSIENEQHTTNEFCSEDWSTEVMGIDEVMIKPDTDREEPKVSEQSNEQVPTGSDFDEVNVKKNIGIIYENSNEHVTATSLEQIHERCHDQAVLKDGKKDVCESSNNSEEVREISTGQTITVLPNKQEKSFAEQVEEESSFPEETKTKTKSTKKDKRPKITVNTKMKKTPSSSSFDESMAMFSPLDIPNNWGDCDFDESLNEPTFYHQTLSFN